MNFFQPSFKLKSKTRDGARVSKVYHPPATSCDRLLACERVDDAAKQQLQDCKSSSLVSIRCCVFRTNMTARFGIVTADFGSVTGRSGDVTTGVFVPA